MMYLEAGLNISESWSEQDSVVLVGWAVGRGGDNVWVVKL